MSRKTRKRSHHKAQSKLREQVQFLSEMNHHNTLAMEEGPIKKKWSIHDLKHIMPLTEMQEEMFHAFYNGNDICAHGSAGTGKTFLALYLALAELLEKRDQHRIIIVRSAVSTRDIGHLPGTIEEKMSEYERPYREIVAELIGRSSTYDDMKQAGLIEFMSTSYVRGLTWDNAIVIVDEAENMTFHEIDSVMTRLGKNSRVIVTGDIPQTDLVKRSNDATGLPRAVKVIKNMKSFVEILFTRHDIVRGEFVKAWITAAEDTPG